MGKTTGMSPVIRKAMLHKVLEGAKRIVYVTQLES
jgi:hypothetical protein